MPGLSLQKSKGAHSSRFSLGARRVTAALPRSLHDLVSDVRRRCFVAASHGRLRFAPLECAVSARSAGCPRSGQLPLRPAARFCRAPIHPRLIGPKASPRLGTRGRPRSHSSAARSQAPLSAAASYVDRRNAIKVGHGHRLQREGLDLRR